MNLQCEKCDWTGREATLPADVHEFDGDGVCPECGGEVSEICVTRDADPARQHASRQNDGRLRHRVRRGIRSRGVVLVVAGGGVDRGRGEMSDRVSEETMPGLYAVARKVLANCDWYDENGKFRTDSGTDEDLVIATMIHFMLEMEAAKR
jgi:hypothetical protein